MDAAARLAIELVVAARGAPAPALLGQRQQLLQPLIVAAPARSAIDPPRSQRLDDGVDAIDHASDSILSASQTGARARARRRSGPIARDAASAPRSIAGTSRSSSGPSAAPVSARRIG